MSSDVELFKCLDGLVDKKLYNINITCSLPIKIFIFITSTSIYYIEIKTRHKK